MLLPFDELDNIITKYTMPFFDIREQGKDEVIDEVYELLVLALVYGIDNVNEWLGVEVELPIETTESILFKPIDGMTWADRISLYFDTEEDGKVVIGGQETDLTDAILKIAESETTRVFSESEQAAAEETTRQTGRATMKTWQTQKDERVRDTHRFLQGVTIPTDQRFWTIDGDSALTPGGFLLASNNCSCRCYLTYSWA